MSVAFIGLGIMGSRMAGNLLKNDVELTVFNRSAAPMQPLAKLGALMAGSYQGAVQDADVVFTMLPSPEVVAQVALAADGFLASMQDGAIWVDCSTVNPSFSIQAGKVAARHHIRFVDAPVAGSKQQAESAELVFLAGGSETDINAIDSLLNMMGSRVVHVGDCGKGAALKMLVNSLLAQSMLAFSEAVLLGEKLGLERDFLLDLLPNSAVCAPFLKAKAEMIRAGDDDVQFPLELMHKDLHLAALTAFENDRPFFSVNSAKELFAAAKQGGLGRKDFASIYEYLRGR
jgi:3-hydroxyisobutyrate dehydrogenase-like beta-hydroxyacid dehydrogenase